MNDSIILTNEQFSKIFNNAYVVVIDGWIYDVYDDYETEDGTLCTAFVEPNGLNHEVAYLIPREVKDGRVSYNPRYKEFCFEDAHGEIPPFKILSVASFSE